MPAFRFLLIILFVSLLVYTSITIANHGFNLLPIFFGDMIDMAWPGQFNFDFFCFLILSATWLAWRHHFTPAGLAIGLVGLFGGMMFLAPYLFFASLQAKGDVKELLLGRQRAIA